MNKVEGSFVNLDGEKFYKIENYDFMNDFFMTLTSSSDVWNFLWAQGGITAGRKNSDNALFPYATCDKLSDSKNTTGSISIIKIMKEGKHGKFWQPFESLLSSSANRYLKNIHIKRNIYKNLNGTKIWFEEVNAMEGLSFRYGWTSSRKFGLVKTVRIENFSGKKVRLQILDGCKNILSSSITADLQASKSVLLDAYKKCEVDDDANMALFSLSSVVTDKAEPSECLNTNVCWFTTHDKIILSENAVRDFINEDPVVTRPELFGKRGECYILHESELNPGQAECWEQVLDVNLDACKLAELKNTISDRRYAWKLLEDDIKETDAKLESYIVAADGIQNCGSEMTAAHHRTNVMFNIMRGGIFADNGKIHLDDFIRFVEKRNFKLSSKVKKIFVQDSVLTYDEFYNAVKDFEDPQLLRLSMEYVPVAFSRRHGDPSRPWNKFNIEVETSDSKPVLNYEGNWRDIFQNWEALVWSYPLYVRNFISIFLNAMTIDGFNPYRISRDGPDWEVPEKDNPWSQYGYWTDHQVIYLQKFLEFYSDLDRDGLCSLLGEKVFTSVNVPYRIKSYSQILADPRHSIEFDYEEDKRIRKLEKEMGADARLVLDENKQPRLFSFTTKIIQVVLGKVLNHVPGCGIWMNLQRPEWNDANNALAGYGASVVTLCQLYRMLEFLAKLYRDNVSDVELDFRVYDALKKTAGLYDGYGIRAVCDAFERKKFVDEAEKIFEAERNAFYKNEGGESVTASSEEISSMLVKILAVVKQSILMNKRSDSLFHSYNILSFEEDKIECSHLKLMLEGQVAVLSAGVLDKKEIKELCAALRSSELYEKHQNSYLLYPDVHLEQFTRKNCISKEDGACVSSYLKEDCNGVYHFDSSIRNAECLEQKIDSLPESERPSPEEKKALFELYEKTFNHRQFTGRSGSFYGYEGLGCIYWHQVSKLLLAVQENCRLYPELRDFYADVKSGLSSAKSPELYGAFPFDPYSHTPYMEGARQPGMTGQVKEEILARWGELGVSIKDSCAVFNLAAVDKNEFNSEKSVEFSWCGAKISYFKADFDKISVYFNEKLCENINGNALTKELSRKLFSRNGEIHHIEVYSDSVKL
ncbi:hypothetical protein [Treponema sp.]|uniref:hypothetical protein n=1 Tax=Treponema sp. TaxID=166 RepID=UPI0025795E41|nr:hypothetical protein [Treponema sp.]